MKIAVSKKPEAIPVSIEDMYRAHMRGVFNGTRGKRFSWVRAGDAVQVPGWFREKWEDHLLVTK
jgi:hypothetical protein